MRQRCRFQQQNFVKKHLPTRGPKDNKTRGGKLLVVAGSKSMPGAALLTAKAAARAGAGYVFLLSSDLKLIQRQPDFLLTRTLSNLEGRFQALAIGPGLPPQFPIQKKLRAFLKLRTPPPAVLDAQALNALASSKSELRLPSHWVLTPHEGEMARLLRISANEVRRDRKQAAFEAQDRWGGVIVLKGHRTLVVGSSRYCEIETGHPALAKAGTGDVLTGMIGGFLAQGVPSFEAAVMAVWIHGFLSEEWIRSGHDVLSLMASDLIERLPQGLSKLRR